MKSVPEQLKDLAELLQSGFITRSEFDQQKMQLLSGSQPPTSPSANAPQPGQSIGAYRLKSTIGAGGMGEVFLGVHMSPEIADRQGGDVAIKVMHAQYAKAFDYQERFNREASLGLKLNHPGIVKVLDLVRENGELALVMAFIKGKPLSTVIGDERGPIPWEEAWPIFQQLLESIEYAHGEGVIHRDLKPENVIIDEEGRTKIFDFGIAKDQGAQVTKTGMGMGTVHYMAPEQYRDAKNVDRRADIYALGMTLYEMLAGRLPWAVEATDFDVLTQKASGDLPLPSAYYPHIPKVVERILMRAIAVDPAKRWQDAGSFLKALHAAADFDGTHLASASSDEAGWGVSVQHRQSDSTLAKREPKAVHATDQNALTANDEPVFRQDFFRGRIGRLSFILRFIVSVIVFGVSVGILDGNRHSENATIIGILLLCLVFLLMLNAIIRRLHDTDTSGFFLIFVLAFLPIPGFNIMVVVVFLLALFLLSGTDGTNKYGPPQDAAWHLD